MFQTDAQHDIKGHKQSTTLRKMLVCSKVEKQIPNGQRLRKEKKVRVLGHNKLTRYAAIQKRRLIER